MPKPIDQKVITTPLNSRAMRLLHTSKTEPLCLETESVSLLWDDTHATALASDSKRTSENRGDYPQILSEGREAA